VPNKGDTAWMTIATVLVILMTIPGLALFYGGLVRSKNMLSILMQVFVVTSLIYVLWVLYGYTAAFTAGNPFIGSLDKLFFKGITPDSIAATFSKGVVIPEYTFAAFQATFAAITCTLRCCCSVPCGSRSATCRSPIWCGTGTARTPSPMPPRWKK
jgi:Amt family ammonium transporter